MTTRLALSRRVYDLVASTQKNIVGIGASANAGGAFSANVLPTDDSIHTRVYYFINSTLTKKRKEKTKYSHRPGGTLPYTDFYNTFCYAYLINRHRHCFNSLNKYDAEQVAFLPQKARGGR